MQVGGERLITIPPALGYGKRPSGPIPANSVLIFETELVSIVGVEKEELREQSILNVVSFCERFVGIGKKFQFPVNEGLPGRLETVLRSKGSWLVFRVVYGRKP